MTGPNKGALGWHVVRVSAVTPGSTRGFDDVKDLLRNQILAAKAADLMYERANKVDNVLGTGADLDHMPDDLGLVGVSGTLDAQGRYAGRHASPVPGPPELKAALVKAALRHAERRAAATGRGADAIDRWFGLLRPRASTRSSHRRRSRSTW